MNSPSKYRGRIIYDYEGMDPHKPMGFAYVGDEIPYDMKKMVVIDKEGSYIKFFEGDDALDKAMEFVNKTKKRRKKYSVVPTDLWAGHMAAKFAGGAISRLAAEKANKE